MVSGRATAIWHFCKRTHFWYSVKFYLSGISGNDDISDTFTTISGDLTISASILARDFISGDLAQSHILARDFISGAPQPIWHFWQTAKIFALKNEK